MAAVALCVTFGAHAPAQERSDPSAYPKVGLDDLPAGYRQWLEEQVVWIITRDERDVFLRLRSDSQRDLFIDRFWQVRDPSPGTRRNEYREMHYDRLAYANRMLGGETSTPGVLTDRGRVWVLLGEPRNRTRVAGGGTLVPSEVWFYAVDPSLGLSPHFYLVFFRDTEFGEYRLWSPGFHGAKRLLSPGGQLSIGSVDRSGLSLRLVTEMGAADAAVYALIRQADLILADAVDSLIPGARNDRVARGEGLIADVMEVGEALMPSSEWAYSLLGGETESTVRFETLPVVAEAIALRDAEDGPRLHLAVRIGGAQLELLEAEGRQYVGFEMATSFRDAAGEPVLINTPRVLDAPLSADEAATLGARDFDYLWREDVPEGATTLDIELGSLVTGEFGRVHLDLTNTAPAGTASEAYRPFLVREVRNLADSPPPAPLPFQLGQLLLVPALDGPVQADGAAWVYWQIRVSAGTSPPMRAHFALRDAGGGSHGEWVTPIEYSKRGPDGTVNHLSRVRLADVAAGRYMLDCWLEAEGGERGRTVSLRLDVAAEGEGRAPIVYARPTPPRPIRR
jgi:GWxTD domain-containing protein